MASLTDSEKMAITQLIYWHSKLRDAEKELTLIHNEINNANEKLSHIYFHSSGADRLVPTSSIPEVGIYQTEYGLCRVQIDTDGNRKHQVEFICADLIDL